MPKSKHVLTVLVLFMLILFSQNVFAQDWRNTVRFGREEIELEFSPEEPTKSVMMTQGTRVYFDYKGKTRILILNEIKGSGYREGF